jgi:rhodanese-related sulfurtransferase
VEKINVRRGRWGKEVVMPVTIAREALKARMEAGDGFVLVDVLSAESYRREHLPGAINLPLFEINEASVADLPRDKDVIVYCASFACQASPMAARKLEELGFTRVTDFEGGLADWKEAGYPLESNEFRPQK